MQLITASMPFMLSATIAAALAAITYLLFRRWRTPSYKFVSSIAAVASLINIALYVATCIQATPTTNGIHTTISIVAYVSLQLAFSQFFLPAQRTIRFIHIGTMVAAVISLPLLFVSKELGHGWLLLMLLLYAIILEIRIHPKMPKRRLFRASNFLFVAGGLLLLTNSYLMENPIFFAGQILLAISAFSMLLIFYDRVVDMVEAVSYSAVTDGLTGLYTKSHFIKKVRDYMDTGSAYALVFSDIDNFKRLNDTQGHQVGDEILKLVAAAMKDVFRNYALVGRYGGEEMVAVIINGKADPGELAEAFRARVEELTPEITPVTVSVGYAIHEEEIEASELIAKADEAMYKAKSRGKNRVVSYQVF